MIWEDVVDLSKARTSEARKIEYRLGNLEKTLISKLKEDELAYIAKVVRICNYDKLLSYIDELYLRYETYYDMTMQDLYGLARNMGIPKYYQHNKVRLIEEIRNRKKGREKNETGND
jgi:hypothetical protein